MSKNIKDVKISDDGTFTGKVDLTEIWQKAEAFDLIAEHISILRLVTGQSFNITNMSREEVEQIAAALHTKVHWITDEEQKQKDAEKKAKEEAEQLAKKKKHWWSKK